MKTQKVKVVQAEVDPVPVEILATSIRNIGIAAHPANGGQDEPRI